MDKEGIFQTIILSFIVALIIESLDLLKDWIMSQFNQESLIVGLYDWAIVLLFFFSLVIVILQRFPNSFKIQNKGIISVLDKTADWFFIFSLILVMTVLVSLYSMIVQRVYGIIPPYGQVSIIIGVVIIPLAIIAMLKFLSKKNLEKIRLGKSLLDKD